MPPRSSSPALIAACCVILLAAALGMWRLEVESIWHDEAWSIRAIQSPFGTPDDNTPPLYYITLHLLQRIGAGESPFALRYGSVLIFLLVVALGFRITWRWFGLTTGILGGSLLALSPLLWEYAQEVRAYIVIPLVALALLAGTDALLQKRDSIPRRVWAFVLIVELAGLYTHNLSVPLVAWLNIVVISVWGWRLTSPLNPLSGSERGLDRARISHIYSPSPVWREGRGVRSRLVIWIISQFILLIAYIPWLLTQSPSGSNLNTVPKFNAELSRNLWRGYILPVISDPDDLPRSFIALTHVLPILVGISLAILLLRGRSQRAGLVISQAILLPILSTLVLIAASIDFHPRYTILAIPATLLMIPLAVATFPQKWRFALALATIVIVAFITGRSFSLIVDNPDYQHDDFRAIADYYATLPDDTLILIPYKDEPTFTNYFDLQQDIIFSLDEIEKRDSMRVELLTWFQVPADLDGRIGCTLGASVDQPPEVIQVKGLTTTGFSVKHPRTIADLNTFDLIPILFDAPISLGKAKANGLGASAGWGISYRASEYGLCLVTSWITVGFRYEYAENELRAAASLINPYGWEFMRADVTIVNSEGEDYRNWQDHNPFSFETGASHNFFPLPDGLPPGEYDVLLRLYSPENPSGFDVIDSETRESLGKDLRITVEIPGNPYDDLPENPAVLRDNTENGATHSGLRLELELQNSFSDEMPLILQGDDWQVEEIIPAGPSLAWASLQIPPDAEGDARLMFGENELAVYNIIKTEHVFEPPPVALEVDAAFAEIAALYGATVEQMADEIEVELVWRGIETSFDDYVMFVQLLDENGALLAQSDAQPDRPTSSWLTDEYITDSHSLKLDALNYEGQVTIIAGMYHPVTRARVPLTDGEDFVRLPIEVTFE